MKPLDIIKMIQANFEFVAERKSNLAQNLKSIAWKRRAKT